MDYWSFGHSILTQNTLNMTNEFSFFLVFQHISLFSQWVEYVHFS